jgi:hypothetical protein
MNSNGGAKNRLHLTSVTVDPLTSRSPIDAMIGVALQAREIGMPQQKRIRASYEALIEAPADSPEAMLHRLGALSACLLDDLAGAQRTKQGQL